MKVMATARQDQMSLTDRRRGVERRAFPRTEVSIEVEWEDQTGRFSGTLSDLSEAGCFVLSSGDVSDGDVIKVFLPLGEGMKVQMIGEVRNHLLEVGFALEFIQPSEAQKDVLRRLINSYGQIREP